MADEDQAEGEELLRVGLLTEGVEPEMSDTWPPRKRKKMIFVYLQCYFVTIAAILGTGILGLPVKLSHSGFVPFLVVFVVGLFAQILVVYYFVELLQKAFVIKQEEQQGLRVPIGETVALSKDEEDEEAASDDDLEREVEITKTGDDKMSYFVTNEGLVQVQSSLSLHTLAQLFLGPGLQQMFEFTLMIMFMSLLICYSLAGSEAYAQLLNVNMLYVIPVFAWSCTFAVVFFQSCVQPFVSVLTFAKGSLLIATVGVTMYVGSSIGNEIISDLKYIGEPFLMGTVAMGGVVNVLPMLFAKIAPEASQVRKFRQAIVAGIWTCTFLNIFWCYAVLEVVPQVCSATNAPSSSLTTIGNRTATACHVNSSLQWAKANGLISTIPLTKILMSDHPEFNWIAVLIQVFVMISITVSFLTMGAGMRHMLDGWFDSLSTSPRGNWSLNGSCTKKWFIKTSGILIIFGIVFLVAMFNPKSFVTVLESAVSLAINVESGVFIIIMLKMSYSSKYRHLETPLPLSRLVHHLQYFVMLYFVTAIAYDVADVARKVFFAEEGRTSLFLANTTINHYHLNSTAVNASERNTELHNRRWRLNGRFQLGSNSSNNTI